MQPQKPCCCMGHVLCICTAFHFSSDPVFLKIWQETATEIFVAFQVFEIYNATLLIAGFVLQSVRYVLQFHPEQMLLHRKGKNLT